MKNTIFLISLFLSSGILADEKDYQISMAVGAYNKNYTNGYSFVVEGEPGIIGLSKEVDFGLTVGYSKKFTRNLSFDIAYDVSPNMNTIKKSTCRDKLTRELISCKVSLTSNIYAFSLFGTYRYFINEYFTFYLGAGVSFNNLRQDISVTAKDYKTKSLESANASTKSNFGYKLGASYKKGYIEYRYLGDTNESNTQVLGISSLLIGFYF